jgi:hypothetical protein
MVCSRGESPTTETKLSINHNETRKDYYLQGDRAFENFWGNNGDDDIYAAGGDDWINGGSGWDYALFSNADNTINLNKNGWQQTGDGSDKLISIEGIDGGGGDDWLTVGKRGEDMLWGGNGIDTFEVKKGGGFSIIQDYKVGDDWIYINSPFRQVTVDTSGNDLLLYQGNDLIAEVVGMGRKTSGMMAEKTDTLLSHTVVKPDACNVVGGIVRRLKAIQNPQGKS